MAKTRRQRLVDLLEAGPWGFSELCAELGVPYRVLDEDLRHVHRSLRGSDRDLRVEPARCHDCGFVFEGRDPRRFHPPGRCPSCRGERIAEPTFELV